MNRRRHRPALIVLVVVAAAVCLLLGWWQWSRFESSGGTARNLGYALQWPLFAVAFLWASRRFVQLEDETQLQERLAAEEAVPTSAVELANSEPTRTALPEGFLPSRPAPSTPDAEPDDPAHAEYNRLLAELAATTEPTQEHQ